jgi:hypothetical protein
MAIWFLVWILLGSCSDDCLNLCRRDRVKRRRAQAKNESKDDIVAASLGSSEQHKGPPDLAELSKDLPTGWQVSILDCSISDANILSCA